tara:strand:+ start:356 stop:550 length:195 start_codon:yes stop_codon:yes gene_type:complete
MSKGRPAHESVEKSIDPVQGSIRNDMRNKFHGPYPSQKGGISIPERPSKKARELMKKGKPVAFT